MKCLSIRSPWWAWILHGGKDIENRKWKTAYRGPVLIHASKFWEHATVYACMKDALAMAGNPNPDGLHSMLDIMEMKKLRGHVVGVVDIVDCVDKSDSPWFVGKHGLVLRNPRPFKTPVPVVGRLGLFDVPIRKEEMS